MDLRPYVVRGAIAALGIAAAIGVVLTDDRDPVVFAIPILVVTTVAVVVLTLADRRGADDEVRDAIEETGLADDGIRPLPTVTPILRDVREPARVLTGDLFDGGPFVRLTRVRDRHVTLTDAPAEAIDPGTRSWLDGHPLGPEAGIEDGLLVVAVPRAATRRAALDVTRELHARL